MLGKSLFKLKLFPKTISFWNFSKTALKIQQKNFSAYVNHRDTVDNNQATVFDFTEENYKKVDEIMSKYPKTQKRSSIMPLLWLAQEQEGNFLSLAAMQKIAKILEVPEMYVYEVASFYTMYNRTPVGKYHLQVCGTTPCMLRGANDIINTALDHLDVEKNHVTSDGLFCVSEVECLGACVNAPMMQVNNQEYYEDLTPESIIEIINKFKNNDEVLPGPQIPERKNSEGPQGRTTLLGEEATPITRDFVEAKKEWEASKVKV